MKKMLCEVDLVIMPSRAEGFGLVALEALSVVLPVLVGKNSGFAQAITDLPYGKSCIVDSEEPEKWATAITTVQQEHSEYLQKIKDLREAYGKKYSWEEQCEALVDKMREKLKDRKCSSASPAGNAGAVLKRERRNWLEDIATGLHQTYSSVHIQ